MIDFISKILSRAGLTTYFSRVEFSAHIAWGIVFGLLGLFVCKWITLIWVVFILYDEFWCDEHYLLFTKMPNKWPEDLLGGGFDYRDTLWDLGSKLFGALLVFFRLIN